MALRLAPLRRLFLPGLLAVIPVAGCGDGGPAWPDKPGPKVVASFPPLYCFALNVAGDDAAVKTAMSSQGPHHFDPKASDARVLGRADVFVFNGLGLDDQIAQKLKDGSGNSTLKLVDLGGGIDPKMLEESCGCEHEGHDHGHAHGDHQHVTDPHVWLGLDLAAKQVAGIRDVLKDADPAHADGYDRRAAEYVAKLDALRAEGLAKFKDKKDRKFVTFHESLAYFARTFDLEVADVIQRVPGNEPTGKEMDKLVAACVEHKVRVIAVEPQYSGRSSAARVLDELKRRGVPDAVMVELDPLETAPVSELSADWYERKTRENVAALAGALK